MQLSLLIFIVAEDTAIFDFRKAGLYLYISKLGITGRSLNVALNRLQTAAQYASSWIWSKERNFQHKGNTRRTIIPV